MISVTNHLMIKKHLWWIIIIICLLVGIVWWYPEINIWVTGLINPRTKILSYHPNVFVDNPVFTNYQDIATGQIAAAAKDELLLQLRPGIALVNMLNLVDEYNLTIIKRVSRYDPLFRVKLLPDSDLIAIQQQLSQDPRLVDASLNYQLTLDYTPNDPDLFQKQELQSINAYEAWDIEQGGSSEVWVAVVDGGTDYTHLDLKDNIAKIDGKLAGKDFISGGDGFGGVVQVDSEHGDESGLHGTHVAGIIAMTGDNGIGLAGVAYKTKVLPLRVCTPGETTISDAAVVEAIEYAMQYSQVKVINLSLGATGQESNAEKAAVQRAINQGITVVASAGNENSSQTHYPAAYDGVIAVASVALGEVKGLESNYGDWVDISAYGEGIYSTKAGGGYISASGTSMAAPEVSGVLALMFSLKSNLTVPEATKILTTSVKDVYARNPIYLGKLGSGIVNVYLALQKITPSAPETPPDNSTANNTVVPPDTTNSIPPSNVSEFNPENIPECMRQLSKLPDEQKKQCFSQFVTMLSTWYAEYYRNKYNNSIQEYKNRQNSLNTNNTTNSTGNSSVDDKAPSYDSYPYGSYGWDTGGFGY